MVILKNHITQKNMYYIRRIFKEFFEEIFICLLTNKEMEYLLVYKCIVELVMNVAFKLIISKIFYINRMIVHFSISIIDAINQSITEKSQDYCTNLKM